MNQSNATIKHILAIISLLLVVVLIGILHTASQQEAYHACEDRVLSQHWDVSNDAQWNAYLRALGDCSN